MEDFIVVLNNGSWEDIITLTTSALNADVALQKIFAENPEYTGWSAFIKTEFDVNKHGDDNYSTPHFLHL